MTDVDDLVKWLRAQLDEDERVARAASAQSLSWTYDGGLRSGPVVRVRDSDTWSRDVNDSVWLCDDVEDGCPDLAREWEAEGKHIARHDPARVLQDVKSKRRIAKEMAWVLVNSTPKKAVWDYASMTVRLLALPYADRPGYLEEWKP